MAHGSRNTAAQPTAVPSNAHTSNGIVSVAGAPAKVNQKKAKRRAKEAAKKQAQAHQAVGAPHQAQGSPDYDGYDDQEVYEEQEFYSHDEGYQGPYDPSYPTRAVPGVNGTNKKNKKKKKKNQDQYDYSSSQLAPTTVSLPTRGHHHGGEQIWNSSTQHERERIKKFWLELTEGERRSLVKVEKEAVLKKMKEQQKHSCSCTVCGRKRTAIEEELEVLYDAYYEELEKYAEAGISWPGDHEIPVPSLKKLRRQHSSSSPPDRYVMPPPGQVSELSEDEEEYEEEEYSDDEDYTDDGYLSDGEPEELPRGTADFFQFGQSLTVKGGILTVADDLLKNDGKKFIEMMEQLAERRMQREEEAQYNAREHPQDSYYNHRHGHGPPDEDDDYDDDEEEYDSQDDDYEDDEDMDTMTEEQRMQEGRRMFQIFAARMFEQRVLTAYREKVAAERQQKLLEELEMEGDMAAAKEAKKAKDAEKRKAKKQAQKQKQQEEKAKKDAEKAAQEAAIKAEQERKLEEQRKQKEAQRLKKEEQRKAQDAELARKQAEKAKRQKEEQERRLQAEQKQREQKELERKAREERKKQEQEQREAREREQKEKKAKEQERREKEAKEKAERDRLHSENQHVQRVQAKNANKVATPAAVPIPPGLSKQPSNFASPHVQPAVPKAPTPVRPRQGSQHGSKSSSPKTPAALAAQAKSGSPGAVGAPAQAQNPPIAPKTILSRPPSQPPNNPLQQQNAPSPLGMVPPPGMPMPQGAYGMPPGLNGFPHVPSPMMHGNIQRNGLPPMFSPPQQPIGAAFPRSFGPPNGMPGPPPGMGAPGMPSFGRGLPDGPPGFGGGQLPGMSAYGGNFVDTMPARSMPGQHSRQHSGSSGHVEQAPIGAPGSGQPRPRGLIQRPASVKPGEQNKNKLDEADELANHLGSSALLGDDVSPEPDFLDRRPSIPPGLQHGSSDPSGYGPPGFGSRAQPPRLDSFGIGGTSNTWGTPSIPFGTPALGGAGWGGSPTGGGWPTSHAFGQNGFGPNTSFGLGLGTTSNPSRPRHAQVRISMIEAYKAHAEGGKAQADGFVDAKAIFAHVQHTLRPPIAQDEMINLLDTEGTPQNGGGSFDLQKTGEGELDCLLKWTQDDGQSAGRAGNIGGVGDIGSPVAGPAQPASASATPFGSMRGFSTLGQHGGLSGLGQGL